MAEIRNFVQQVTIDEGTGGACVQVGPNMADTELLTVQQLVSNGEPAAALRRSMVHALCVAMVAHHEVLAMHGDTDSRITSLELTVD